MSQSSAAADTGERDAGDGRGEKTYSHVDMECLCLLRKSILEPGLEVGVLLE
jgi:hypothetical protein